jgi:hypothetical protein
LDIDRREAQQFRLEKPGATPSLCAEGVKRSPNSVRLVCACDAAGFILFFSWPCESCPESPFNKRLAIGTIEERPINPP